MLDQGIELNMTIPLSFFCTLYMKLRMGPPIRHFRSSLFLEDDGLNASLSQGYDPGIRRRGLLFHACFCI